MVSQYSLAFEVLLILVSNFLSNCQNLLIPPAAKMTDWSRNEDVSGNGKEKKRKGRKWIMEWRSDNRPLSR